MLRDEASWTAQIRGDTMRLWLIIAGIDGAVLILLGAYGAHNVALEPDTRRWFDMAWQYQALHAAALLAIAVGITQVRRIARLALNLAALSFAMGTVLFCGSLYRLALGGEALFRWRPHRRQRLHPGLGSDRWPGSSPAAVPAEVTPRGSAFLIGAGRSSPRAGAVQPALRTAVVDLGAQAK
jgi:uncharacterized membrane protein YgdD (TMEM256/DUF423 family)